MSKIVIDVNAKDINEMQDGDILVYNEEKRMFYRQTAKQFWNKHEEYLSLIIKKYDQIVIDLENKFKELEEKEEKFETDVNNKIIEHEQIEQEFEEKIKGITNKLIVMVENFIKTGGNL